MFFLVKAADWDFWRVCWALSHVPPVPNTFEKKRLLPPDERDSSAEFKTALGFYKNGPFRSYDRDQEAKRSDTGATYSGVQS